jgi:hypothetical protein
MAARPVVAQSLIVAVVIGLCAVDGTVSARDQGLLR